MGITRHLSIKAESEKSAFFKGRKLYPKENITHVWKIPHSNKYEIQYSK